MHFSYSRQASILFFLILMICAVNAVDTDPMNWKQVNTTSVFSERFGHSSVVFNDRMWVIGGFDGKNNYFNDVWSSSDGISWIPETSHTQFGPRYAHQSVVFDNKIWVIGGRDGNTLKRLNDVWYSSDGIHWTRAIEHAQFSPRWDFPITVFDNKIWVIGGSPDGSLANDTWYSSDGIHWTRATEHAQFSPRMQHALIGFHNNLLVIGGFNWERHNNEIWSSADGITWKQTTIDPLFKSRSYHNVVVADDRLWLIGGWADGAGVDDVWQSSDGISWTQVTKHVSFPGRWGFSSVFFKDKLWVIGGYDRNDIWYYEIPGDNKQSDIRVVKSILPVSAKLDTDVKISISLQNLGKSPIHDIEILDDVSSDFPVTEGSTQYSISQILEPGEIRILTYSVRAEKEGSFILNRTKVMFADEEGNYQIIESNAPEITVLSPLIRKSTGTKSVDMPVTVSIISVISAFLIIHRRKKD